MSRLDPSTRQAIAPQEFTSTMLHREVLVDRLHGEISRKLIAVAAPAGYGKTTLLADFVAHSDIPSVWLRVSEAERDPIELSYLLMAGMETRFRRLRDRIELSQYRDSEPNSIARSIATVVGNSVTEHFVLVIDDVHILNDSPPALSFLDELVQSLPENATVVTGGREVPEISLARLMAEGALAGIGPHDLAMTHSEAKELFALRGQTDVSPETIETLMDTTKGWITGLILSNELRPSGLATLTGAPQALVYDYLASVVLNRLPGRLRDFLLQSSSLPYMTDELCDSVLAISNSNEMLNELVSRGVFVTSFDTAPRTYEYHPLFREFLYETFQASAPARAEELAVRTANALIERSDVETAIRTLLSTRQFGKANHLIGEYAEKVFKMGRLATLESWWQALVEAGETPSAEVAYWLGVCRMDRGDYSEALETFETVLLELEKPSVELELRVKANRSLANHKLGHADLAITQIDDLLDKLKDIESPESRAHFHRIRAQILVEHTSRLRDAESSSEQAVKNLEGLYGNPADLVAAYQTMDFVKSSVGKPSEAVEAATKAHNLLEENRLDPALAVSHNNLATRAHETGEFESALGQYSEALRYAKSTAMISVEAYVYLGQGDLFNDLGLVKQAGTLYEKAIEIASEMNDARTLRYLCVATGVLHRRWTNNVLASEWFRRALGFDESGEWNIRIQTELASLEAKASPENAIRTLLDLKERSRGNTLPRDRILLDYWLAYSYWMSQNESGFVDAMGRSLEDATSTGSLQIIAGELHADSHFYEQVSARLREDRHLPEVRNRIQNMYLLRKHFREESQEDVETSPSLELRALGQSEVLVDGELDNSLKPQVKELLFYLAEKRAAEKERLVEIFWQDFPPGRQAANLHMAVYTLRKAIGKNTVHLNGSLYALNTPARYKYDVLEFERASSVAERLPLGDPRRYFALTEAISLYPGPYLVDVASDWAEQRRRNLESRYLDLVSSQADEAITRNDPARAVLRVREALLLDPLRDDLNMKLLQLLALQGRRSELVAHYRRYVSLLSTELGLDPSREISNLYSSLLS